MENSEIAKVFLEMAELLELKEDNPFKIRAYLKAAQTIESMPENVADIIHRGVKIPGIGEKTSQNIEELVKTGKSSDHQKLIKEFPPGFLELLNIPGIGPKGAVLLFKKLKISNIADLEAAAKAGKIRPLDGMGAKKEENILKGIAQHKERIGRFLLSDANQHAESIVKSLKQLSYVDQIVPAGSLRRCKETIGDIDILVTSKKPKNVIDAFINLPQVKEVYSKGDTKSSVVLQSGIKADLRVVDPKSFGAALHYFTGSKQHNIRIREMGIKKGLKISEYGVYKNNEFVCGKSEEEIFKSVGLPYIPPELREDQGEIEAAKKGELPDLVKISDILGDLHMHTRSSDGLNTIEEMVLYAKKLGYKYIAITDHSKSSRVAGGLSWKDLLSQWEEIDKANKIIEGIKILKGAEVDILADGSLDYDDNILKRADVVITSIHSNFKMERSKMTKRIINAMQNKYVNIFSHPTGRLLSSRAAYEVDLEAVIGAASKTGTYIEINAHPERLDLDDIHCRRAKEKEVCLAINSDAHRCTGMDFMKFGISVARRGWLEKKNIINCLPLEKLLDKLYAKRK